MTVLVDVPNLAINETFRGAGAAVQYYGECALFRHSRWKLQRPPFFKMTVARPQPFKHFVQNVGASRDHFSKN